MQFINCPGHQLFAGSGFAGDQYIAVKPGKMGQGVLSRGGGGGGVLEFDWLGEKIECLLGHGICGEVYRCIAGDHDNLNLGMEFLGRFHNPNTKPSTSPLFKSVITRSKGDRLLQFPDEAAG